MLTDVTPHPRPIAGLEPVIGGDRTRRLRGRLARLRRDLDGCRLWHVNSTATGGGVAEMLPFLIGYLRDAGIDARWIVIGGSPPFFTLTKRLHNLLHGSPGDGGPVGERERLAYEDVTRGNASILTVNVRPGDVVVLHDPQTAGLVRPLRAVGATVVWRCHIGCDTRSELAEAAWSFLRPYVEPADTFVFSRRDHAPPWVPADRLAIIPPSIDPLSSKNAPLSTAATGWILADAGMLPPPDGSRPHVRTVARRVEVVRSERPPSTADPLLVQISRWDRLKDMTGVLRGFASGVDSGSHLALVGPSVRAVADDPEGGQVLMECATAWDRLPARIRSRVHLWCLPMDDVDENATMVNALQRHATVVIQKSLQEGFGLTVTEAMWKGRAIVASAVGGIRDQIVHGEHGLLLDAPGDLHRFVEAVGSLLDGPEDAGRLGAAARQRAWEEYLPDRHLTQYAEVHRG